MKFFALALATLTVGSPITKRELGGVSRHPFLHLSVSKKLTGGPNN